MGEMFKYFPKGELFVLTTNPHNIQYGLYKDKSWLGAKHVYVDLPRFLAKHQSSRWLINIYDYLRVPLIVFKGVWLIWREKITSIVTTTYGGFEVAAYLISIITRKPLNVYLLDLYMDIEQKPWKRSIRRLFAPCLFTRAAKVFVMSESLGEHLKTTYKVHSIVIPHPVDLLRYEKVKTYTPSLDKQTIVYTGMIYDAHRDCMLDLIQAISDLPNVELHIYTPRPVASLKQEGIHGHNVNVSFAPHQDIPAIQKGADILFLPMGFNSPYPKVIQTASPGKIAEYLAAGRPILVYAPPYAYISHYASSKGFGLVVDQKDPEKLRQGIIKLLENKADQQKYITKAKEAVANHEASKIINEFMGQLNPKKKVLLIAETFEGIGGVEKYCRDLKSALSNLLGESNVRLFLPNGSKNIFVRKICTTVDLLFMARRFSPDYIYCGHVYSLAYVAFIARVLNIPYVVCAYGIEVWRKMTTKQIEQLKQAAGIITISRYTKDRLIEKDLQPDKISIVYPRINVDYFVKRNGKSRLKQVLGVEGKRIILTVGRMASYERYKGHDELIGIMPEIVKKVPEAVLLIVGGGDDVARLKNLSNLLGMEKHIVFSRNISNDDLPLYYEVCDVFVMYSRVIKRDDGKWGGEGFGIVYLEANAAGKPVIGAKCGGTLDAVVDQETGILVEPDDLKALTNAVVRLLLDREYAEKLGQNGREWVKRFDLKRLPLEMNEVLRKLEKRKCAV